MKKSVGGADFMPKELVGDKYAALEKAYFTRMASKKVFDAYRKENSAIKSKIDTYVAKQTTYYKELHTTG